MKYALLALMAIMPTCAMAQVKFISPANQAHGTSLPPTCSVGDLFQLTTATSTIQLYSCTAVNTWTQDSSDRVPATRTISTTAPLTGGGNLSTDRTLAISNFGGDSGSGGTAGAVPAPAAGDAAAGKVLGAGGGWITQSGSGAGNFPTASISGATATFFGACTTTPCNVIKGSNQIDQITATNSLTAPASGSAGSSIYVYWTSSGCAIGAVSGVTVTGTGSGQCAVASNTQTGFPNDAVADLFRLDYAGGVWTAVKNYQPAATNPPVISAGNGLLSTLSPGVQTFSIDTSTAPLGNGTANFVPRWTNGFTLGNSLIQDNTTNLGFNCAPGTVVAIFCGNAAAVKAVAMSNSNAGGHAEFQLFNDGGLIGGFGTGGSTAVDHANGIYLYNNTGSFDGWMSTGWTFRTGAFPGTLRATIPTTGGIQVATASEPTCDSTKAGTFFYVQGNATTKDKVEVCAHDASNVYAWRAIY